MRKTLRFLGLFLGLLALTMPVKAQTDVTNTYLTNAGFDTAPITYTKAGGTTKTAEAVRIGTTGWIFEIPGWSNSSTINANAVQVASGEYGTVANSSGFNNVAVPATDVDGNSTGAALSMSAGWGDKAAYYQSVTLPAGKYVMKLNVYNAFTVAAIVSNTCGFVAESGTTYYSALNSFPVSSWTKDSIVFTLPVETAGKIQLGMTTSAGSSGNGAKVFIDNVKLISYGLDKSGLKTLIDSATVMVNNPQPIVESSTAYTDLTSTISAANIVFESATSTIPDIVDNESYLKSAISLVYEAIQLKNRIDTWVLAMPYDATAVITNNSFEQGLAVGWTNLGLVTQSNTSMGAFKNGATYAEKWTASPGTLKTLKVSQIVKNIPNGIYKLTVAAQAIQQTNPASYPGGAFIYAGVDSAEVLVLADYEVLTKVTNNQVEIGFQVDTTGNWVAIDNFRLSYISDGSPYTVLSASNLAFTPNVKEKVLNVKGDNFEADLTLSTSANFTLSKTTLTPAEIKAGVDVTVTALASSKIESDSIVLSSGSFVSKAYLSLNETAIGVSNYGYFFDQSLTPSKTLTVSGDLFGDVTLTAPEGVTLFPATVTVAEALAGKAVNVLWNQNELVNDKYIYLTSGAQKDSVVVFAAKNSLISDWDANDSIGTGTKLTDWGWSHTLADGVTSGGASFGDFAGAAGVRLVTVENAAHTYKGKALAGHRTAYLRTWGNPATNAFNLEVELEADKQYAFRGLLGWHNNETNPTYTIAVNTAKANTGDTLGIQAVQCTVKQQARDYGFTFVPKTSGVHYLTVTSSAINDAMAGVSYLAIYPVSQSGTVSTTELAESGVMVYPTVARGSVTVKLNGELANVQVYSVSGKLVFNKQTSSDINLNLSAEGMYIVKVSGENVNKTVKVLNIR